jgi:SAM-dependent methyltransferase
VNTSEKKINFFLKSIEQREINSLITPLSIGNFVEIIQNGYSLNVSPKKPQLHLCLGCVPPVDKTDADIIIADPYELPLKPESVDMALLTHVLEFVEKPQLILREIYQTLAPQGLLYVLGFNPFSLLGLSRYFHPHHKQWPYTGKFLSIPKVLKDARRVGYAVLHFKTFAFYYSRRHAQLNERLLFLEPLGQFIAPGCGGIYCIVLQKNILGTIRTRAKKEKAVDTLDSYV